MVRVSRTRAEKELRVGISQLLSGSTLLIPTTPNPLLGAECALLPGCLGGRVDGSLSPVLARCRVGVQWVLGLQMGSLRPARGWALPTIIITEKVSEARILVVLSVTGSFYGSGPAPACPIPGASLHRGVVAAVQAPVHFVCNYLIRKPGSCHEQVSANRPMSLPRDPCP